jgi:hypothetical protein
MNHRKINGTYKDANFAGNTFNKRMMMMMMMMMMNMMMISLFGQLGDEFAPLRGARGAIQKCGPSGLWI